MGDSVAHDKDNNTEKCKSSIKPIDENALDILEMLNAIDKDRAATGPVPEVKSSIKPIDENTLNILGMLKAIDKDRANGRTLESEVVADTIQFEAGMDPGPEVDEIKKSLGVINQKSGWQWCPECQNTVTVMSKCPKRPSVYHIDLCVRN